MSKGKIRRSGFLAIIFVLILGLFNIFAHSGIKPETEEKIKINKEWKGSRCGYVEPSKSVISTEDQWKEIWDKMFRYLLPEPELPKIDFEKEMILAAFMGERRTGGYEIRIKRVRKTDKEIIAYIEERKPDPESFRTMALTQPYHVVVIKKYSLPVRFQHL